MVRGLAIRPPNLEVRIREKSLVVAGNYEAVTPAVRMTVPLQTEVSAPAGNLERDHEVGDADLVIEKRPTHLLAGSLRPIQIRDGAERGVNVREVPRTLAS